MTHVGIITLLIGSFMTMQFGVDGNLPVTEREQNSEVMLQDLVPTVSGRGGRTKRYFPVPE